MSNEFETKLASAGEMLEQMAKEAGLSVADFSEQEINDILTTLMGEDKTASALAPGGTAGAGSALPASTPSTPAAAAPKTAQVEAPKFTYGEVMAEVTKFAAANDIDLAKASAAELDEAVVKMAAHMAAMATPEMQAKQAALQEKAAEADAMGRVMAHAYADELSKIAAKTASKPEDEKEREEKEKAEKKAAFVNALKVGGEMPEAFKKHMKGKEEGKEEEGKDEKEEKEKEAAFAKQASLRASEILILRGTNPATGMKFASEAERLDAAAVLLLQQKGY